MQSLSGPQASSLANEQEIFVDRERRRERGKEGKKKREKKREEGGKRKEGRRCLNEV